MGQETYDLVLLDLMLPKRDGLEVLTALRRRGLQTPVLVLTAKDTVSWGCCRERERGGCFRE